VSSWIDQGIMSRVQRNKLVFVETRDSNEISLALKNYFKVSGEKRSLLFFEIQSFPLLSLIERPVSSLSS